MLCQVFQQQKYSNLKLTIKSLKRGCFHPTHHCWGNSLRKIRVLRNWKMIYHETFLADNVVCFKEISFQGILEIELTVYRGRVRFNLQYSLMEVWSWFAKFEIKAEMMRICGNECGNRFSRNFNVGKILLVCEEDRRVATILLRSVVGSCPSYLIANNTLLYQHHYRKPMATKSIIL